MNAKQKVKSKRQNRSLLVPGIVLATVVGSFAVFTRADTFSMVAMATPSAVLSALPSSVPAAVPSASLAPLSVRQSQYLAKTTLKSLHDAIRSGNFTVFHDLAGPSLQSRLKASELSKQFDVIAKSGANLTSFSLLTPTLVSAKEIGADAHKMLRLDGYFEADSGQLHYGLLLEPHNGKWLVADYAVELKPTLIVSALTNQPPLNKN